MKTRLFSLQLWRILVYCIEHVIERMYSDCGSCLKSCIVYTGCALVTEANSRCVYLFAMRFVVPSHSLTRQPPQQSLPFTSTSSTVPPFHLPVLLVLAVLLICILPCPTQSYNQSVISWKVRIPPWARKTLQGE